MKRGLYSAIAFFVIMISIQYFVYHQDLNFRDILMIVFASATFGYLFGILLKKKKT